MEVVNRKFENLYDAILKPLPWAFAAGAICALIIGESLPTMGRQGIAFFVFVAVWVVIGSRLQKKKDESQ